MANTILCVFEGEKRDPEYFASLQQHFFSREAVVKCSYGNDLYHLLDELEADDDLDVVELIRESTTVPNNSQLLAGIERDGVAQVFLFFDMEPHDDQYTAAKLQLLIERFNQETEFGKLYVSYPMVEALRDIPAFESFSELTVALEQCRGKVYKRLSAERREAIPQAVRDMTLAHWLALTACSVSKACNITELARPLCPEQYSIFVAQSDFLRQENKLYVLSAFPFFLKEYFGENLEKVSTGVSP